MEEMGVAIICLLCVIAYQGWLIVHIQRVNEKREKDLLDRVMTRNYETFVQAEVVKEQTKPTINDLLEKQPEYGIDPL